ncbi:MAG: hypothetical protein HZA94_00200 [Candidatus Vogelbacteria bacterium]|nr:hypothetical protein [Candidatus Vogelbacteria bacterium]
MSIYDESLYGNKKTILLRTVAVLVLLSGLLYIIYNDYRQVKLFNKDSVSLPVATSTRSANQPVATISTPAKVVSEVKAVDKITLAFPLPDLDRPYTIPLSLDAAMVAQTRREISSNVESLKSNPDQFGRWLDLALLRKLVEDYIGAEEIWIFTSKEWPDSFISHANLGDLYTFYLKDSLKAEISLKKVIEISPNTVPSYRNLFMLYTNQYIEKKSEALPTLLSGIKANPKAVELMILVASYYKDSGDNVKALEYYSMALPLAEKQANSFLIDFLNKEIKNL